MSAFPKQLDDNWYMGRDSRRIVDLADFRNATKELKGDFRLEDIFGNPVTIRMGGLGVIVVEGDFENGDKQ